MKRNKSNLRTWVPWVLRIRSITHRFWEWSTPRIWHLRWQSTICSNGGPTWSSCLSSWKGSRNSVPKTTCATYLLQCKFIIIKQIHFDLVVECTLLKVVLESSQLIHSFVPDHQVVVLHIHEPKQDIGREND